MTIRYSAKLITIKEKFAKAQGSYVDEINKIMSIVDNKFSEIDLWAKKINNQIEAAEQKIATVSKQVGYINTDSLERLVNLVERFSKMSKQEKDLIKSLIEKGL